MTPSVEDIYIVMENGVPKACYHNYTDARVKECELHQHHMGEVRIEIVKLPVVRK